MDTSETYIKMCDKAEEIQKSFTQDSHSFCVCKGHHLDMTIDTDLMFHHFIRNKEPVWLPRQDQLQEMLIPKSGIYQWLEFFGDFVKGNFFNIEKPETQMQMTSYEQLWLAFVMKEKYGKSWNGSEWIPEIPRVNPQALTDKVNGDFVNFFKES